MQIIFHNELHLLGKAFWCSIDESFVRRLPQINDISSLVLDVVLCVSLSGVNVAWLSHRAAVWHVVRMKITLA